MTVSQTRVAAFNPKAAPQSKHCEKGLGSFTVDSSVLFIKGFEQLGTIEITDNSRRKATDFCIMVR